jgi:hypothetical protein
MGKLQDEAVGPTQVQNGSLTGTDIAGDSLTGTQIDESTLDTSGNVIGVISGGVQGPVANNDFMMPSGSAVGTSAVRNTVMLPVDARLSNFRASARDHFMGSSVIVDIFKVSSGTTPVVTPTSITCSIPAFVGDGTCVAPPNAINWNAGDLFTYRMTTAGPALTNGMSFSVTVEAP